MGSARLRSLGLSLEPAWLVNEERARIVAGFVEAVDGKERGGRNDRWGRWGSSEGRSSEEGKVSDCMELRAVLLQLTSVIGNEDTRGNVFSFRSILWNLSFAVLVPKERFLIELDQRGEGTETEAL